MRVFVVCSARDCVLSDVVLDRGAGYVRRDSPELDF
jgi:hypothetical protein